MHALCLGERTVTQIVGRTGASQTNVSRHLGLMHRHGMVARRKEEARSRLMRHGRIVLAREA